MYYKVKQLATLAGVSIRTLHHYDAIGLLQPSTVSEAGYRLYSEDDAIKLQHILFWRELEFSLADIATMLRHSEAKRLELLEQQRTLLEQKQARLQRIIDNLTKTIGGVQMTMNERFDGFDESELKRYAAEAKERWGGTPAYEQSAKRTKAYTKDDWTNIQAEANAIYAQLAMRMDEPVSDDDVQQLVAQWRAHISRYYYDCTPEIFAGLAETYVADERFTANIDRFGQGLAKFLSDAMKWYCQQQNVSGL